MYIVNLYSENIEHAIYNLDITLLKLELTNNLNAPDEFYFEIDEGNPGYNYIESYKTRIDVLKDKNRIFFGRVVSIRPRLKEDGTKYKEIKCKCALSFLDDIYSESWSYINVYPEEIIFNLLAEYNKKVSKENMILSGNIGIREKISIVTNRKTVLKELSKLPMMLGGILKIRYSGTNMYLDYIKEYHQDGDLNITVEDSFIDFIKQFDDRDIATRLIPLNKDNTKIALKDVKDIKFSDIELAQKNEDFNNFTSTFTVKTSSEYIEYIEDIGASKEYGVIEKTWTNENLDTPSSIFQSAKLYLKQINQPRLLIEVSKESLKAIIKYMDNETFDVGDIIHIYNEKLKLNVKPIIIKSATNLLDDKTIYTITTRLSLFMPSSEDNGNTVIISEPSDANIDLSYLEEIIKENEDLLKTVKSKIEFTQSYIEKHKDTIELGVTTHALEEEVKTINGLIESVKKTISDTKTYLELHKDSIELGVTSTTLTETVRDINGSIRNVDKKIEDTNTYLNLHKDRIEMGVTQTTLTETVTDLERKINAVSEDVTYKVDIISTGGSVFRTGEVSMTLIAVVYKGVEDVTAQLDANRFRWTRTSLNPDEDIIWNQNHYSGAKRIEIFNDDVKVKATFTCEILST